MAHDHRCVQTRPETEIGRHGAMLWIVVKIAAFKVEQPFVLELQERHKQASARVRVPLARIALPLQPRNLYGTCRAGPAAEFRTRSTSSITVSCLALEAVRSLSIFLASFSRHEISRLTALRGYRARVRCGYVVDPTLQHR